MNIDLILYGLLDMYIQSTLRPFESNPCSFVTVVVKSRLFSTVIMVELNHLDMKSTSLFVRCQVSS